MTPASTLTQIGEMVDITLNSGKVGFCPELCTLKALLVLGLFVMRGFFPGPTLLRGLRSVQEAVCRRWGVDRVWPYRQGICAHVCEQGPFRLGQSQEQRDRGGAGQDLGLESKGKLFPTSLDF